MENEDKAAPTETAQMEIPETLPDAVKVTAEDLVAPMAADMPKPTGGEEIDDFPPDPNLPPKVEETAAVNAPKVSSPNVDDEGNVFDAAIYKVENDGSPLKKNGKFVRLKRGRPSGSNSTPRPVSQAINPATGEKIPDEFDNAAILYFDMGTGLACAFVSDEFKPDNENERAGMVKAVAAYLRAKGDVTITPGQALAFALVAYCGARLGRPKTSDKLKLWALKIKTFFTKGKELK